MPTGNLHAAAPRRGESGQTDVALYAMSAYTSGLRKPGHFHLLSFEEGQNGRINRFVPHCHDFFEIVWLPAGRGQVRCDLHTFTVKPRTLFFAAPGQVHAWQFTAPPEGEIVSFTHDFFMVNSENPGFFGRLPFLRVGARRNSRPRSGQRKIVCPQPRGLQLQRAGLARERAQNRHDQSHHLIQPKKSHRKIFSTSDATADAPAGQCQKTLKLPAGPPTHAHQTTNHTRTAAPPNQLAPRPGGIARSAVPQLLDHHPVA
ncbi:MAG: AraC family ligand binding domain-containing protein [Undibacterium sp.]|nr:AraC family ligand binding domain-containing protein [Opitutaceae bacterium]